MRQINTPTLETPRLILRKFTQHDLDALYAIYADKEVNTYLPWFPLQSMDEAKQLWQEKYAEEYQKDHAYRYAICFKSDDIPIGYVHVSMDDSYDLGYGLRKEFWHKGIATEAGRAVVDQVKADGIPYLTATHDKNNPRSGGVMIQLGMQYKYSFEEQWQPKNILVTFRMYQLNFHAGSPEVYTKYWDHSSVHFIEKE